MLCVCTVAKPGGPSPGLEPSSSGIESHSEAQGMKYRSLQLTRIHHKGDNFPLLLAGPCSAQTEAHPNFPAALQQPEISELGD